MNTNEVLAWEMSGVPVRFIWGLDGYPYAAFSDSYDAENYARLLGDISDYPALFCCGGFENGVRLQEIIGM